MKILFAIQGTGNGHISRAREIIPYLEKHCNVDILVSGYQADVDLNREIKYRFRGLSFIFGKKGGVDIWNTYIKANINHLRSEIKSLPITDYDFVINDFEPVSSWAAYSKKVPCIALSHQSAILDKNSPKPKKTDLAGKFILKNYAPHNLRYGLHFCNYSKTTYTPIIRKEIREAKKTERNHYTVYLPSYNDDRLMAVLKEIKNVTWQVFSKHNSAAIISDNVEIYPISNDGFIESLTSCIGILCGAGFETPAEALYLGKKLMVIPMENQYEQQCNAAALKTMGIPVLKKLKPKYIEKIQDWVDTDFRIEVSYPDITEKIVNNIFASHIKGIVRKNKWDEFHLTYPKGKPEKLIYKMT